MLYAAFCFIMYNLLIIIMIIIIMGLKSVSASEDVIGDLVGFNYFVLNLTAIFVQSA